MEEFSEFVENNELVDLPMVGRKYTWARGGRSLSMSRLDRFVVSSEWVTLYSHPIVASIPKPISDHCPILLDCEKISGGPKPFRFEIMWFDDPTLLPLLKSWWRSLLNP
ncbi:hypothetical protein ACHQM5_020434 [Ranunculus cassubicifolius]